MLTAEQQRLNDTRQEKFAWKKWGPYLSERQWGTVREDYSEGGDAWDYFTHDQARSRAYRWGEDGIAGVSDDKQHLCFALAVWNGKDPILKERLSVVALAVGQSEEPLLENRVLAVPHGQREAQVLFVIGNAGNAVLPPAVGT